MTALRPGRAFPEESEMIRPLPTNGRFYLTDGGIETTLIFHNGLDLPHFAAFDLLKEATGRDVLGRYYLPYLTIAQDSGVGFILESPTWRANPDWAKKMGYSKGALAAANKEAIQLMKELRVDFETRATPILISGCVGPRGDGYNPDTIMTPVEADSYHREQIAAFSETDADMVTAITITNTPEAIGISRASLKMGMPVAISFTVETDGRLPTGQSLEDAINEVDNETAAYPAYYMINCAHPTHFADVLAKGGAWRDRIRGIRANASRMSHAELDEAETLDDGNPQEFGHEHADLRKLLPNLSVIGGCCGTDERHIREIAGRCTNQAGKETRSAA